MSKRATPYILLFSLMLMCFSCSTTKVIPEGSYRLRQNKVIILNKEKNHSFSTSKLSPYIRQKPNSYFIFKWNPFLNIYNWSNGKGKGWDKFVQKLGQAPVVFDSLSVEKSIVNIKTQLEYLGYYNSIVTDSVFYKNKLADVSYIVQLGKRYPINSVEYSIADTTLRNNYYKDTANSLIKKWKPLSEDLLDDETSRVTNKLKNNGYYNFSKNYFYFEADTTSMKDYAALKIKVENFSRNDIRSDFRKTNIPSPHKQFYLRNIYVYPVSNMIRYQASLTIRGDQILDTLKHGNITIIYDNKLKIRPSVLDNTNQLVPGALYRSDDVDNTYRRFTNLRLYNSVNLQIDQSASDSVDCTIKLLPSKIHGYKLNLEASLNSTGLFGISPAVSYYNRNIFRGGEWFNLSLMGNFQRPIKKNKKGNATEFGATAGVSFPTFLFLPDRLFKKVLPRTDVSFTYNYQRREEYTRNMIRAQFGYSWNSRSNNFFYQVSPIQLSIVNLPKMSKEFYESLKNPFVQDSYKNHFDFGANSIISYQSDPSLDSKKSNFKANLQLNISGNLLSAFNSLMKEDTLGKKMIWGTPYSQYVRGELSLVYTWIFGKNKKQAVAVRGLGGIGYAYGNSSAIPFERLFWAGGSNSLRGWSARTVGPGSSPIDTTFSIPNQTGDFRLEANVEYRFPLFWLLRGAVFFDAGNVWNLKSMKKTSLDTGVEPNNILSTVAFNTGVGLRVDIQFVVIRFDLGIKLYEPSTLKWRGPNEWFAKDGFAFQFGIGYPF